MNYRYHLLKYRGPASRLTCPACGKKRCFAPYVEANDQIVGEEYGRCDHESSCGYVKYPTAPKRDWREPYRDFRPRQPKPRKKFTVKPQQAVAIDVCTIPTNIVSKTVRMQPESDFVHFLGTLFDAKTVARIVEEYSIGVTKGRDAIFYQIDTQGRCRTGKVMKYNRETGHRIKDDSAKSPITWVHSLLKRQGVLPESWELTQCLFGEHLLKKYPDKPICLVEAEKTAIICAASMPEFVWVAVGGKTQLGDKVEVLEGRTVIAFPDTDGYEAWVEKTAEKPYLNIQVSDYLVQNATDEDHAKGADVADVLIRWMKGNHAPCPNPQPITAATRQSLTYPDNPVMQEVMKYISPEHWDNVDALIRELDLEFVGVTRILK